MSEIINLSNSTPAAPSGTQNVSWQKGPQNGTDPGSGTPIYPVSANVPIPAAPPVSSVAGRIGAIVLAAADVGLGNVTNDAQLKASALDTDGTMAADSDAHIPSQKAVVTYVAAHGGPSIVLKHNGTLNGSQSLLNLVAGSNITIADDGSGDITIIASGGGAVSSVFGRTGAVVAASGDYTPAQVGLGNVTNDAQLKASALDTDGTMAANSDAHIPSQKAVVTYVAAHGGGLPAWLAASPDVPPTTPGSLDDEFLAGSSIDLTRWTWLNQGGGTGLISNSWMCLTAPGSSGDQVRALVQTMPAAPWKIVAKLAILAPEAALWTFGFILRDASSGCFCTPRVYCAASPFNGVIDILNWSAFGTAVAEASGVSAAAILLTNPIWLQLYHNGTSLIISYSYDGSHFLTVATTPATAYVATPTQVGLFIDLNGTTTNGYLSCDYFRRTL